MEDHIIYLGFPVISSLIQSLHYQLAINQSIIDFPPSLPARPSTHRICDRGALSICAMNSHRPLWPPIFSLTKHKPAKRRQQDVHETSRTFWHHLYTLWLFNFSDLKTIVLPESAFAIITLLSGQNLMKGPRPPYTTICFCLPLVLVWTWLNMLPLAMSNQYSKESTEEDRVNKPWRPIPAGRVTMQETQTLMIIGYVVAFSSSLILGGTAECVALILQGWMYNYLDGGNKSILARNFINATGCLTFAAGASRVACLQSGTELHPRSLLWFIVLGGVILTSIQIQDLYDRYGDSMRGRRTIPILLGDELSRLTIGIPIAVWSFLCPAFWGSDPIGFALPVSLGTLIILRLYFYRSVDGDRKSYKLWNAWITTLYLIPFFKVSI